MRGQTGAEQGESLQAEAMQDKTRFGQLRALVFLILEARKRFAAVVGSLSLQGVRR